MRGYSPTIQSLRGFAVWIVVLYHSRFWFSGGFVGVDIFFVLSGFLIFRSLIDSYTDSASVGDFLKRFFVRRTLRLVPALAVTSVGIAAATIFVFSPFGEIQEIAISGFASLAFVSNGRFFLLNEYSSLEGDPFRHTWSLAVEEQFYIGLALIFVLVIPFSKKSGSSVLRTVLVVAFAASFFLCIAMSYGVRVVPLPSRFAFFSPVTRGWQFLAGALLASTALSALKNPTKGQRLTMRLLQSLGVILLGYCALQLDIFLNYPGWHAVGPTLATLLVLIPAARGLEISSKFTLFTKFFEKSGDLSYSLYLIHWPILVVMQKQFGALWSVSVVSIPVALVLASLQYRFVELRFHLRSPGKA